MLYSINVRLSLNGSIYERELASILSGQKDHIARFLKGAPSELQGSISTLKEHPFFVTRSAGSLGADIIAIRGELSAVIEVKSSVRKNLMFTEASGKRQEQAERLVRRCAETRTLLLYAFRLKGMRGETWRVFAAPGNPRGILGRVYDFLPKIDLTRENNFVLNWENGKPLSGFLDYANKIQSSD